ncbi:MAG: DEAD/DEAH box helicase [Tannerella sp.]|nr:DEAD/DEAH box helicase [Tannerella sp.]
MKKTVTKRKKAATLIPNAGVSYHRKPENLSSEKWQSELRRQYAEMKPFGIEKTTKPESLFGDYTVHNPETGNSYKVAFRGIDSPMNYCSCMDFRTNHLGTCKHLEALLYKLKNTNQSRLINREYSPEYTSVYLSYRNGREVKIRLGNDISVEFDMLVNQYFDTNNTLRREAMDSVVDFLFKAHEICPDFRCYEDALEYVLDIRELKLRSEIAARYHSKEDFDDLINTQLYPYQQEGVRFAFEAGRSLNADEMGLGKTIQAIATCQMLRKERGIQKILIICPTSLKYQWQSEIYKFTSEKPFVIEGLPNLRYEQYGRDEAFKIVSYNTVLYDVKHIIDQQFDMLILDEAQRIKNWKTKIAQAVKKIQTPYCMVLTGTPLENKIEELYSIIQFVNPYILGPYWCFLDYYQVKDESNKTVGYHHLDEIGQLLGGIVKRRRKRDVMLQLPDRMDKNLFVPMTEQQADLHHEYGDVVARLVNKWKRTGFLTEKERQRLLIHLNLMRMSCDSTYIIDQKTRHDTKIDELMSILTEYFDGTNEKAVIFSQWERMTRIIAHQLDDAGIEYRYLHGGVPSKDRKALFDAFNNNPSCRVFLSTDAGSTGLNLQAASLIINMDIPWNPAILEQRIARIHRMGQKNCVSVINFVSLNTIEHKMLGVLKFKSSLAEGILDNGENAIFMSDSKFDAFMRDVEQMTDLIEEDTTPVTVWDVGDDEENASSAQPSAQQSIPQETVPERAAMERAAQESAALERAALESTVPESASKHRDNLPHDPAKAIQLSIFGDDDFAPESDISGEEIKVKEAQPAMPDATELISQGFSFISGLAKTLSTPDGATKLSQSLVETDATTGRTHLKIPVESVETVSNVLNMLGNLFKNFTKG